MDGSISRRRKHRHVAHGRYLLPRAIAGRPPFIEIGSKVNKGDPICIIEVMKLLTTIHAEWSGTVKEIGAENATPVEYGQMLFVIEPAV